MLKIWNKKHSFGLDDEIFVINDKRFSLNTISNLEDYKKNPENFIVLKCFELFRNFTSNHSPSNERIFRSFYKNNFQDIQSYFLGTEVKSVIFFKDGEEFTDLRSFFTPVYLELASVYNSSFSCLEVKENCEEYFFNTILKRKINKFNNYKQSIIKEHYEREQLNEQDSNSSLFTRYSYWDSLLNDQVDYGLKSKPEFNIVDFDTIHKSVNEVIVAEKEQAINHPESKSPFLFINDKDPRYDDNHNIIVNKFLERALVQQVRKLLKNHKRLTNTTILNILSVNCNNYYFATIVKEIYPFVAKAKLKPSKALQSYLFSILRRNCNYLEFDLFEYCLVKHKISKSLVSAGRIHNLSPFYAFLFNYEEKTRFKRKVLSKFLFTLRNGSKRFERYLFEEYQQNIVEHILRCFSNSDNIYKKYKRSFDSIEKFAHSKIDKEIVVF